ncbi:MAG: hypothetical protein IPP02_02960 [Chitinophagaceae bacterium]|nr:hypothetical protein [Chitinophagaceae bacterium]
MKVTSKISFMEFISFHFLRLGMAKPPLKVEKKNILKTLSIVIHSFLIISKYMLYE